TMNFVDLDPALRPLIESYLDPADRELLNPVLTALGADAAQRLAPLGDVADKNPRPWRSASGKATASTPSTTTQATKNCRRPPTKSTGSRRCPTAGCTAGRMCLHT